VTQEVSENLSNKVEYKCSELFIWGLFYITIYGLTITYIVFIIMSICQTSYSEQKDICEKSNAWLYLLLNMIISIIIRSTKLNSTDSTNLKCHFLAELLVGFVFVIWGCIELFGIGCFDKLKSTLFYTMVEISVISNIVGLAIMIILELCVVNFNA
jgi:hypothetical protein